MSLGSEKIQKKILNLVERIQLFNPTNIANIGATSINATPVYMDLVIGGYGHLFVFDGDSRQVPALKSFYGEHASVLNHFLADGNQHTAYICREDTAMTSRRKPDQNTLAFFNNFASFEKILRRERIQTTRLDGIDEIGDLHFVKLDVQGLALSAFTDGLKKALELRGCTLEIYFICLYKNQPSFGQVDMWMRCISFAPHRILKIKRWSFSPTPRGHNFRQPFNQLLETDIVYVKDPLNMKNAHLTN